MSDNIIIAACGIAFFVVSVLFSLWRDSDVKRHIDEKHDELVSLIKKKEAAPE
ncbi:MAG TPA: hypothetical protein PLB92_03850 [Rhodoglobus sp.]|nr:hypothetical protein [Rhodoglobus sp.]